MKTRSLTSWQRRLVAMLGLLLATFVGITLLSRFLTHAAPSVLLQAPACPTPTLRLTRPLTLDAGAEHFFVPGDFNGDGKQDLVVQTSVGKIYTLLGDGAGNLATTSTLFLPGGGPRLQMASGDFNGDGRLDIITLSTAKLEMYLNNGGGVLTIGNSYNLNATNFLLGDFNEDGKTDIAVTLRCCPDGVVIYLSTATGFTATNQAWGAARVSAVADFNGDDNLDLLTSDNYYPSSQVRLGNGRGEFTNGDYLFYGVQVYYFAATDFNKDGKADVLGYTTQNRAGQDEANSRKLLVLSGDGAGHFAASYPTAPLDAIPLQSVAADFTGDGYPDIANRTTDIFANNGAGGLCAAFPLVNSTANKLGTADFNGDGKADLLRQVNGSTLEVWTSGGGGGATNTPPTLTLNPTSAPQGLPVRQFSIGRASDAETPESNLEIRFSGQPLGVVLTSTRVSNEDLLLELEIACNVAPGAYQIPFDVTDSGGLKTAATWPLTITANQAPVLGTYANTTVNASTVQIAPSRAPGDDGALSSLTVAAPGYAGAISIAANGVVTITNNNVAGSYAATVTARDNCGLIASTNFTFTIPSAPPPTGCDSPSFRLLTTVTVPAVPAVDELIPGDFNNDGFPDVIAIRKATTTDLPLSQIYFGDGRGGLTLHPTLSNFDNFIWAGDVVRTGDFNGDGYLDLSLLRFQALIGSRPQYASFQTLLNDKQGRLTGNGGSSFEGVFYDLEVGDLNNDGFTDAVLNTGYNYGIWLNNRNGSFTKSPDEFGTPPKVILADVNVDGKLDVLNDSNGNLFLWLGDGTGKFRQDRFIDRTALRLVVDVNKDGRPDIVSQASDGSLNVYQNRTVGFALASYPEFKGEVTRSGDFNGDGAVDLLLADGRIVVNDGFGRFCTSVVGVPAPAGVADFDGDGRADLLSKDATHLYLWKSERRVVGNTPPQIVAGSGLQLPAGSTNYRVPLLARISDGESSVPNLSVVATVSLAGITVENLVKDTNGNLELSFTTNFCTAPASSLAVNLVVTDEGGLTASASVPIQLLANPAPLLGEYAQNVQAPVGQTLQWVPGQRPLDNGPWTLQVIQPATGGGTASVNNEGLLTITNTTVPGTYTARVRVVEQQCANVTERSVTYIVTGTTPPPPPGGCDPLTFNAPVNIGANNDPYGLASGDFNGDGKADLATTNRYDNTVTVLLATASGYAKQAPIPVGVLPNYLAARDLNADGKLDLAVGNRASDTITILLGNGDGTFAKKGDYQVGNKSTGVAIGDFNRDGKLDLALPNDGLGNVAILNGNGDGSFTAPRYIFAGDSPQPGIVADFNKDGVPDLAFPNYNSGNVVVLLGLTFGGFNGALVFNTNTGAGLEAIAAGDLDGDGNPDLAMTNTTTNAVTILRGDGRGMFTASGGFATFSNYPASLVVADFTGDGKADIAVGGYNDDTVHVFKGLGNGFDNNNPTLIKVGTHPLALLANDFNGDGKPDLAVANQGAGTVAVLLNGCVR